MKQSRTRLTNISTGVAKREPDRQCDAIMLRLAKNEADRKMSRSTVNLVLENCNALSPGIAISSSDSKIFAVYFWSLMNGTNNTCNYLASAFFQSESDVSEWYYCLQSVMNAMIPYFDNCYSKPNASYSLNSTYYVDPVTFQSWCYYLVGVSLIISPAPTLNYVLPALETAPLYATSEPCRSAVLSYRDVYSNNSDGCVYYTYAAYLGYFYACFNATTVSDSFSLNVHYSIPSIYEIWCKARWDINIQSPSIAALTSSGDGIVPTGMQSNVVSDTTLNSSSEVALILASLLVVVFLGFTAVLTRRFFQRKFENFNSNSGDNSNIFVTAGADDDAPPGEDIPLPLYTDRPDPAVDVTPAVPELSSTSQTDTLPPQYSQN
ncbi:hypothetical protein HK100_007510 [Physocladia obscura]|uniref:Uncharacterized protein n=1 Tax=Physocladia obscura TaxID=109957 RepID=A0AAD5SNV4_9FUNG|nr:hypothetical protein HK100_007510 [Physocladia obscura]